MGLYLNPDNSTFKEDFNSRIYVDKSLMIAHLEELLGTSDKFVCVSRPRRFGKSMAGNMISAYYSKGADSGRYFDNLKIASVPSYGRNLNKVNVIKFDLNGFFANARDLSRLTDTITSSIVVEFAQQFPDVEINRDGTIPDAIAKVYSSRKEQFIIIIDEYDVLVREKVPSQVFEDYIKFLSSLFKNTDLSPAILLAYLTGILPIVRDRVQSKLNMFEEYSMTDAGQFAEFVGFTAGETKALCEQYGMDYEECRRWYDGYSLNGVNEIFSPKSVVTAIKKNRFGYYWTKTGSYEALKDYILLDFKGIKDDVVTMMGGGRVDVEVTSFLNTTTDFHSKDDVFTCLIHLGYLAYDWDSLQCYIPNEEIRRQWVLSVQQEEDYAPVVEMINASKRLLEDTLEGNEDAVAEALTKAHSRATNPLTYNSESSFQSAVGLAYFYANARYTVIKELPSGKGYADIALIPFVPDIPAIIIELKNAGSATGALNQIKERRYDEVLEHYRGDMLLVGVNYDPGTKDHRCIIERYAYK